MSIFSNSPVNIRKRLSCESCGCDVEKIARFSIFCSGFEILNYCIECFEKAGGNAFLSTGPTSICVCTTGGRAATLSYYKNYIENSLFNAPLVVAYFCTKCYQESFNTKRLEPQPAPFSGASFRLSPSYLPPLPPYPMLDPFADTSDSDKYEELITDSDGTTLVVEPKK